MAHVYTVLMGTNNNLHAIKTALFTTDQIASDPDLALDDADMRWLIAQAVEAWEERWYGADRYYLVGNVVEHVQHVSQWKTARGWPAVWREARRLVRLVETLGIDWPTDADLETAPEGGEA